MTEDAADAAALPPPPIPSDVNLQHLPYMPLQIHRLLKSDTWVEAADDPKVGHALMCLWCESWHQVPAASLPSNDRVLARLALCDYGTWERVREKVMRDWTLCSDGRYYHSVVAEIAAEQWEKKQRYLAQTEAARRARQAARGGQNVTENVTVRHGASRVTRHGASRSERDDSGVTRDADGVTRDERHAAAERARRYREKKRIENQGDSDGVSNSECHSSVTENVTESVTSSVTDVNLLIVKKRKNQTRVTARARNETQVSMLDDGTESAASSALPAWLAAKDWDAFVEHRRKLRKPLSEYAAERQLAKLDALRREGNDPAEVIRQTIDECWIGLFPVKPKQSEGSGSNAAAEAALVAIRGFR